MSKFNYVIVFLAWLVSSWGNVEKISDVYSEEFQNVTQTELVYDQDYQHYYVEFNEVKRKVDAFSEPKNCEVSGNHRIMADGKDVVCFEYCDELRIYPKEEFDDHLKVELCADEMGLPICNLMAWTAIYLLLGVLIYKRRNG